VSRRLSDAYEAIIVAPYGWISLKQGGRNSRILWINEPNTNFFIRQNIKFATRTNSTFSYSPWKWSCLYLGHWPLVFLKVIYPMIMICIHFLCLGKHFVFIVLISSHTILDILNSSELLNPTPKTFRYFMNQTQPSLKFIF